LLGDAPGNQKLMPYPTLKVADWGMAEYTSLDDERNSKKWKNYGTIVWMPPVSPATLQRLTSDYILQVWTSEKSHTYAIQEQRHYGRYGESWERCILGGRDHPFSMKHVVWQIGANIYGLMTLDMHNKDLDEMLARAEGLENMLRKHDYSPLFGYKSRHYSSELTSLVEDCVRVDPARRPSPYELVKRTQEGLARHEQRYRKTGEHPKLKL